MRADVSKVDDCRRLIDETVNQLFNKLIYFTVWCVLIVCDVFIAVDHLVNNAAISAAIMFEEVNDITNLRPVMVINFPDIIYRTNLVV
jgi:NAD(P)-dependent dehydrogenase (short-subunit alcohol dehydrogenase family)